MSKPAKRRVRTDITRELAKLELENSDPLRLRFDKVVLRVDASLRAGLLMVVPDGVTALVALTAPIRLPARTAAELREIIKAQVTPRVRKSDWIGEVCGNKVRIRIVTGCAKFVEKAFLLVHNDERDAKALLDRAQALLA